MPLEPLQCLNAATILAAAFAAYLTHPEFKMFSDGEISSFIEKLVFSTVFRIKTAYKDKLEAAEDFIVTTNKHH